jgi:hypothetical protein
MQKALHESKHRFRVGAWGRQSGKSTWAVNEITYKAINNPNTKYWFVSPTYDQAKIQYRRITGALWNIWPHIGIKQNMSELRMKFLNNSEIVFKSGDNYDNLRGESLDGVIIDEVRDQHPDLWPLVIRPMLTTTQGWAAFISTPRGFDQFYDLANRANADTSGLWKTFTAPSTCNPSFTQSEFETLKGQMSEAEFAQEILAEFRDLTAGKAYLSYGQHNHAIVSPFAAQGLPQSPWLPFIVSCDFNVNPMAWNIGQCNGISLTRYIKRTRTLTNVLKYLSTS